MLPAATPASGGTGDSGSSSSALIIARTYGLRTSVRSVPFSAHGKFLNYHLATAPRHSSNTRLKIRGAALELATASSVTSLRLCA
jgi:hypothetical protein